MSPALLGVDLLEQMDLLERLFEEREPVVGAFLPEAGRFERLRRDSRALVEGQALAGDTPPLFGLTVGVKDIFHVDGFSTRAGSHLPAQAFSGPQAESVNRLGAAGALIVGKTVTTEFAYFSPGPTRNPRNPMHTPGGSSSGSAAAIAAGMCSLALGTQTIGSIIRPAAFCGVVGLKPTYDRVSREGVIPLSPSLDHVGFFTCDVDTALEVASVLYRDWSASGRPTAKPVLGIPEGPYLEAVSAVGLVRFQTVCRLLGEAGYETRRVRMFADFDRVRARHELILAAEAASVHTAWFAEYEPLYRTPTADLIRRGKVISPADLARALRERDTWRAELARATREGGIDLWISPSAVGPAPMGLESTGDPVMNLPWTQAGWPALNLPAGTDSDGLPLGLQLTARWRADEALLSWAADIEKTLAST